MRNVPEIHPRSRVALAIAALLVGVATPGGRAAAQTFYGCSPGGNCATVRFTISPTPNERGRYRAALFQSLRIDDFRTSPVFWFGARLSYGVGGNLVTRVGDPDAHEPFTFSEWIIPLPPGEPRTVTTAEEIGFFTAPTIVRGATLVISERPVGLPVGVHPGYSGSIQDVPLVQIAPLTFLPEPSTLALMGGGVLLTGLAAWRRRRAP